jgi:hypothetical protein
VDKADSGESRTQTYDKKTAETRSKILEQEGPAYCGTLLAVVRNITKEDVVLYALVLIHQLLQGAARPFPSLPGCTRLSSAPLPPTARAAVGERGEARRASPLRGLMDGGWGTLGAAGQRTSRARPCSTSTRSARRTWRW